MRLTFLFFSRLCFAFFLIFVRIMRHLPMLPFLLWLLLSCDGGRHERMLQVLAEADSMNRHYVSFTSDSLLADATRYFDSHGTPNERLRSHYLLGCAYRDMGQAPQALQCYQDAADCADTTAADCDYQRLMAVYGQTASLFYDQIMPRHQIEALKKQHRYAILAGDTMSAVFSYEFAGSAYELLNNLDSAMLLRKLAYNLYTEYGYEQNAAAVSCLIGDLLIKSQKPVEAKSYLDKYEASSGFFDGDRIIDGREIYYYTKGMYYLSLNQTDSAELLFRRCIGEKNDLNCCIAGNRGLSLLYQLKHIADSVGKYAMECYVLNDSSYRQNDANELRRIQSLYDYSRFQTVALEKSREAHRNRQQLTVSVFFIILLIILCVVFVFVMKVRQKEREVRLRQEYKHQQDMLLQAQYDLYWAKEQHLNSLIEEKTALVKAAEKNAAELKKQLGIRIHSQIDEHLMNSEICRVFHYLSTHPLHTPLVNEWRKLHELVSSEVPGFYGITHAEGINLKDDDYHICLLIRLHFSLTEIIALTGKSKSYVSMKRSRLLEKIFSQKGKAEDFDRLIQQIFD